MNDQRHIGLREEAEDLVERLGRDTPPFDVGKVRLAGGGGRLGDPAARLAAQLVDVFLRKGLGLRLVGEDVVGDRHDAGFGVILQPDIGHALDAVDPDIVGDVAGAGHLEKAGTVRQILRRHRDAPQLLDEPGVEGIVGPGRGRQVQQRPQRADRGPGRARPADYRESHVIHP